MLSVQLLLEGNSLTHHFPPGLGVVYDSTHHERLGRHLFTGEKTMTQEEHIDNWHRIISEQEKSGANPSHSAWLATPTLHVPTYGARDRKQSPCFLRIFPATGPKCPRTDTGIRIHLNASLCIQVASGFLRPEQPDEHDSYCILANPWIP